MTPKASLSIVAVLGFLAGASQTAPRPAAPQPQASPDSSSQSALAAQTAREALIAMEKVYTECKSYRDSGTIVTQFIGQDLDHRESFETRFVRGVAFRFAFQRVEGESRGKPFIAWSDGKATRRWSFVDSSLHDDESLGWALAHAGALTSINTMSVPRLLLPNEISGTSLAALGEARYEADELLGSRNCLRIVGRDQFGNPRTVWIDRESHLILKMLSSSDHDGLKTETTTTFIPEVNATIDSAELAFNPPESGATTPK